MSDICIIIAKFYQDIAAELVRGATEHLAKAGLSYEIIEVPGAFEIPSALNMAIMSEKYAGFVTLGCVIRGKTTHYDYVCSESARGINQLAIEFAEAVGYGILTVETPEQAWERAAVTKGNKGADAASACLAMLAIKQKMAI